MFYYLLYKSSLFEKYNDKGKLVSVLLTGSIIYIIIHAFISFTKSNFINNLKSYFWIILILDIIINILNKDNVIITKSLSDNNKSIINNLFSLKTKMNELFKKSNMLDNMIDVNNTNNTKNVNNIKNVNDSNDVNKNDNEIKQKINNSKKVSKDKQNITQIENEIDIISNNINTLSTPISEILDNKQNKVSKKKLEKTNLNQIYPFQKDKEIINDVNFSENLTKQLINNNIPTTNKYLENNNENDYNSDSGSEMDFNINEFSSSL